MAYKETGSFPSWVFLVVAIHIVLIGGVLVGLWFIVHEPKKKNLPQKRLTAANRKVKTTESFIHDR